MQGTGPAGKAQPAILYGPNGQPLPTDATTGSLKAVLAGSLAPLPSRKIDLVGSWDGNPNDNIVNGNVSIPAGGFYQTYVPGLLGNRSITAAAYVSGTSPNWTIQLIAVAGNNQAYFHVYTSAAQTGSYGSVGPQPVDWDVWKVIISNNSTSNALTINYLALGVQ
jgi:hypothetical protein